MRKPIAVWTSAIVVTGFLTAVAGTATPLAANAAGATKVSPKDAISRAEKALGARARPLAVANGERRTPTRTVSDRNGASHVRFARTYQGLRVRGGDFVVHNGADGSLAGISAGFAEPLTTDVRPRLGADKARAVAKKQFVGKIGSVKQPELLIDTTSGAPRLAWETVVSGVAKDGQTPSVLHVVTDAAKGDVLSRWDEIHTADGTGQGLYVGSVSLQTTPDRWMYQLKDPDRGSGYVCDMQNGTTDCTLMTDVDNTWGDGSLTDPQSTGVDAAYGIARTYDYFKNTFGRAGVFGDGTGIPTRVHYGNNYNNAFWSSSDKSITFGDGAGNQHPYATLDIVAHEMTHGVTENLAGLVYADESGGLNEATSDIFGEMVEFSANNAADKPDYVHGDKKVSGWRYMYDPALDGNSDSCWSTSTAGKDVHYSSGVGNHFFFMLAEGSGTTPYGTSPVCGNAPAVTGIGRTAAAAIWYRALDVYFTSTTSYKDTSATNNDARQATLNAAVDLYGLDSVEYRTVQAAWNAVNIDGEDQYRFGFDSETVYDWGNGSTNAFTGDFNGDGKWDIGVTGTADQNDSKWYIRYGNGLGGFGGETVYDWGNSYTNAFTGDFNGDGKWDLGVTGTADQNDRNWYIRYGNGDGTFGNETIYYWGNGSTNAFTGDFNGDGKWDIGVTGTADQNDSKWYIRYGNGDGTFGNETVYDWGNSITNVFTGDFNGDGKWDIGVTGTADQSYRTWFIRYGNGDGSFDGEQVYDWGNSITNVFTGDFNGDGKWDLGVTGTADQSFRTWFIRYAL